MKFKVIIDVNLELLEDEVMNSAGTALNTKDKTEIIDAIEAEFGWLRDSGIFLEDLEEIKET